MPEQFSPIRFFVTLLVLIFCIEGAMVFALNDLLPKGTPVWVGASIDVGLLTAITSLCIWRLFMRPLQTAVLMGSLSDRGCPTPIGLRPIGVGTLMLKSSSSA
jgi:hypothetical protein